MMCAFCRPGRNFNTANRNTRYNQSRRNINTKPYQLPATIGDDVADTIYDNPEGPMIPMRNMNSGNDRAANTGIPQMYSEIFPLEDTLENGTLFDALYMPYKQRR